MASRQSGSLRSRFHTGDIDNQAAQSATSDSRIFGAISLISLAVVGLVLLRSLLG